MRGPRPLAPGQKVVGRALTLQFMPQREDVASGLGQEYIERHTALWAVLETVQPGDVLVVQAYGSAFTGCFGDMLVRYFKRKGGAGIVVDGRIRDAARVRGTGRAHLVHRHDPALRLADRAVPVGVRRAGRGGGVLALPGDLVVADDDGAVVVPAGRAAELVDAAAETTRTGSAFSRSRSKRAPAVGLLPVEPETRAEYEAWRDAGRQPLA